MSIPFELKGIVGPTPRGDMLYRCFADDVLLAVSWLEENFPDRHVVLEKEHGRWPCPQSRGGSHFTLHMSAADGMLLKLMT